ncbi:acylphosphatase [Amphibacillus cookii]|uniref:acylphosphatase n=1 Tax=Amphibacillus cookii TaxID=767787 RepID=UPI00195B221B|nr:acylphosphatase [Amphibacillus cookii]MBM7542572.1 acylphosphatase [Amphibacillus cookii]
MSRLRAHMIISGRVQGVGFRYTTQMKAKEIGVCGWVKNLPDDTVEIEGEGEVDKLYQFIDAIKAGPSPSAKVEDVDLNISEELKAYQSFDVVY